MARRTSATTTPDANNLRIQLFQPDLRGSNLVKTSKYTWYTFVPVNLFEQLTQLGNAYFLLVALLQVVKSISNTDGRPLTLLPLSFVLSMGAIKDGYEDRQRLLSDREANESRAVVVDEQLRESTVRWQDIRPGMLIRVRDGEQFPVDALLLASSSPGGRCFVETANLDGESNLKRKVAAVTAEEWEEVRHAVLAAECEPPSVDLYKFRGALRMPNGEVRGLGIGSLLLRGTSLQQTSWVLCMALYCGHETRALKNSRSARFKISNLDVELSKVVMMIFAVQMLICASLSVSAIVWLAVWGEGTWYLMENPQESFTVFWVRAGSWLLQTNSMVPVSLMVTLTGVKFVQGLFIGWDPGCRGENGRSAKANTSQVIESLGQITHVFSDKTGTLTRNLMEYRACSVAGRLYGLGAAAEAPREVAGPRLHAPHVDFAAGGFLEDLGPGHGPNGPETPRTSAARAAAGPARSTTLGSFLLCEALCHTVEASATAAAQATQTAAEPVGNPKLPLTGAGTPSPAVPAAPVVPYSASSPDELALVCCARELGVEFVRAIEGRAELRVRGGAVGAAVEAACGWRRGGAPGGGAGGGTLRVDVLDVCEFDSDRKRMSVVVRFPDLRLVLFVKGADTSILPHIGPSEAGDMEVCEQHLMVFARQGLRTLVLASRTLDEAEYTAWHARYAEAQAAVTADRAERVHNLAVELETVKPLTLLGATAIEDRLQDEVPETIEQLRQAGVRVWVLTGDQVETAISIARSCKLLDETMTNIRLESTEPWQLDAALRGVESCENPALTISGAALGAVLASEESRRALVEAAYRCKAVICCRVSPKQKADVVQLVRSHQASAVTLSIGDGANDVSMIVTAHVGVGISGKEGAQAAHTADFAISDFRILRRLMFYHGRESYRRTCVLVLYNFWKNMLMVMPTILNATWSGFTGLNVFHPLVVQLYNVFYTHLPVCFYGICDRSRDPRELEYCPEGYAPTLFGRLVTAVWLVAAFLQACTLNILSAFTLHGRAGYDGEDLSEQSASGHVRFIWLAICANVTMAFRQTAWYSFSWMLYAFNIGSLFLSLAMIGSGPGRGDFDMLFGENLPRVVLVSILAIVVHILIGEPIIRQATGLAQLLRVAFASACQRRGRSSGREAPAITVTPPRTPRDHLRKLSQQEWDERTGRHDSQCFAFAQESASEVDTRPDVSYHAPPGSEVELTITSHIR